MESSLDLELDGRIVAVTVRRSTRASRLSVKLDPVAGPVVTLPPRCTLAEALNFLQRHRAWLSERLAGRPAPVILEPGSRIPILGTDHEIRHHPAARRGVWAEDGVLNVSGLPDHIPRRTRDYLKAEAKRLIYPLAFTLAGRLGRTPCRVTIKDTRTRWGSCSSRGDLAFSWRLVMAPESVLTYVVAHEVAHLVEMNHSPAFWTVVKELVGDPGPAKRWLKGNGARLYLVG